MHLISYGLGDKPLRSKFEEVKNDNFNKPLGGMWSSPVNSNYGWIDFCKNEEFRLESLNEHFEFKIDGTIYTIDTVEDLYRCPKLNPSWSDTTYYIDFEQMIKIGYDAIYLTENGQHETRFHREYNRSIDNFTLYGWDVECVLILNFDCIVKGSINGHKRKTKKLC